MFVDCVDCVDCVLCVFSIPGHSTLLYLLTISQNLLSNSKIKKNEKSRATIDGCHQLPPRADLTISKQHCSSIGTYGSDIHATCLYGTFQKTIISPHIVHVIHQIFIQYILGRETVYTAAVTEAYHRVSIPCLEKSHQDSHLVATFTILALPTPRLSWGDDFPHRSKRRGRKQAFIYIFPRRFDAWVWVTLKRCQAST